MFDSRERGRLSLAGWYGSIREIRNSAAKDRASCNYKIIEPKILENKIAEENFIKAS